MNTLRSTTATTPTRSHLTRRRFFGAVAGGSVLVAGATRSAAAAPLRSSDADAATRSLLTWTDLTLALIQETRPSPAHAARALALVHVAMAEATRAADPAGSDIITGAATTVLSNLFPQSANQIATTEQAVISSPVWTRVAPFLASQPDLEAGQRIGEAVIAWSEADGSDSAWDGEVPTEDGLWQPTPPDYRQAPLDPMASQWRPWVVADVSAMRPAAPPAWGSPLWEAERLAVQEAVAQRTPAQAAAVHFWAGGPGTVTPAGIWITIARDLIVRDGLDAAGAARVLALTSVAMVDAFICCWDAKFAFWMARPITTDPTLNVLIPTPPFPSYTSGHATVSAAAATTLSHLFPADAPDLLGRAVEARNSRLWAGIHFPIDNEVGAAGGAMVGRLIIARAAETGAAWDRFQGS